MSDYAPTNLLFIFSDQHTRRAVGCMGHPVVKTPHMDALAERGTVFRSAYCNGPICVPSRASLATGRYVFDIGKWDNCKPYFGEEPSWGHRLASAGHRAVSIGKLHYRREGDSNGFENEHLPMHILNGQGMLFTICRNPMPISRKFSHLVRTSGAGESTYTGYDRQITERAIEWLRDEATRSGKPWALFVSLVCPHPPWKAPADFYRLYPLEDIDLPLAYSKGQRPVHPGLEDYRHFFGVRDEFDEQTLRRVIASYYGMISFLDDNVGKLLETLDECGLTGSTRIIYTSDHGESMGQKGMFSKCNMFEESVGIPMIMAGPGVPAGRSVDAPTQLLDLFPTILESTGVTPTDEDTALPGTSLLRIADGDRPERVIFAEQHSAGAKSAVYMLRNNAHKYVRYMEGYPPQLYDLEVDPLELDDLSTDPDRTETLAASEARLNELIDPKVVDEAAKADQAERLEAGGGPEAIVAKGSPGYTPAPGESPVYM
ncbi:MAG: sulfatase-like hydrolase/transferase [Gammaproteobacteria bacterium]